MEAERIEKGIRNKDSSIYEYLIDTYSRLLWRVASGILSGSGTKEDIEEVVSEVFIALWEKPKQYDPERGSLKGFLCLKARSLAIDKLRSILRTPESPLEETLETDNEDIAHMVILNQRAADIGKLIKNMDPPDREILTLRFIYELKPSLIAEKLKLPVGVVYEKIRRGKERIIASFPQEV